MKPRTTIFLSIVFFMAILIFSACQRQNNICPPIEGTPGPKPILDDLIGRAPPNHQNKPVTIEIGGKPITVDKLVNYPICNDTWQGTVYVGCDAQVAEADSDNEDNPLFFKGCNLQIEPGTIVFVAAHNDAAYYKGCSCHTGAAPIP